ncbi:hypothetical protein EGJ27_10095 [Pseudomonas sp. v388]|nr:hypothetical protein EGJ27_10095 [Pseudomonas sp. v388]
MTERLPVRRSHRLDAIPVGADRAAFRLSAKTFIQAMQIRWMYRPLREQAERRPARAYRGCRLE